MERFDQYPSVDLRDALEAGPKSIHVTELHRVTTNPNALEPKVSVNMTELYATTPSLPRMSVSHRDTMPVLWLTGLPAAGKSTIAGLAAQRLMSRGIPTEVLDGDDVRKAISPTLGFTRDDRALQTRRLAWVAELLSRHGVVVIVAAVSPFRKDREAAADLLGYRYTEIWVHADAAVCRARDPKGLWRRCELGEISGVTGFDAPYEAPTSAAIIFDTEFSSASSCASKLVDFAFAKYTTAFLNIS